MMIKKRFSLWFTVALLISPGIGMAQGIFDAEFDWPQIGQFFEAGSVEVAGEGADAVYTITGNGIGLGNSNDADEGFYVYREMSGSWSIEGRVSWDNPGAPAQGSIGLMIRQEPENPSSRHYSAVMRMDSAGERAQVRYRNLLALGGLPTNDLLTQDGEPLVDPGDGLWLRLSYLQSLNLFMTEFSMDGAEWTLGDIQVFPWQSEAIAYGLFIANDADSPDIVRGRVRNVSINPTAPVVERSLSQGAFRVGDVISVSLDIHNAASNAIDLTIEEIIPEGWTASNISNGGVFSDGQLVWEITAAPEGVTRLSYQATPPEDPATRANWSGGIAGGLDTQGKSGLLYLEGDVERVTDGLLVLYDFTEGGGDVVHDRSGIGDALDLTIANVNNVVWGPGSLRITAPTRITSGGPVSKLFNALFDIDHDGSITVEAWIAPDNTLQLGPARIVTYSSNPSFRNFTLGQQGDFYQMRIRTGYEVTDANRNGTTPHLETPPNTVSTTLTHLVYVRDSEWNTYFYLNGERVSDDGTFTPDYFDNWDGSYQLALGNEIVEERPFLGEYFLVAIYNRGLTADETAQNFASGPGETATRVSDWALHQ